MLSFLGVIVYLFDDFYFLPETKYHVKCAIRILNGCENGLKIR